MLTDFLSAKHHASTRFIGRLILITLWSLPSQKKTLGLLRGGFLGVNVSDRCYWWCGWGYRWSRRNYYRCGVCILNVVDSNGPKSCDCQLQPFRSGNSTYDDRYQ